MSSLSQFKNFTQRLPQTDLMPTLFIGHGSPMNGIEHNEFSQSWADLAKHIPVPKAVLVVSAHWYTRGTFVTAMDFPSTIHDFGGFPQALFDVQYPVPGDAKLAAEIPSLIHSTPVGLDHDWGLDHGTWTIVRHMYPKANIPVLQLSIDYTKAPEEHYEIAKEIYALRKKGILVIGSGNMVHNLRMLSWEMINGGGYDWANEMNDKFKNLIANGDHKPLMNYRNLGPDAMLAIPTPEHYLPLIYTLGLKNEQEDITFFNDKAVGGSLTMTSVLVG
ncbi:4,5-DOPA dioxygenase extradiol [Pedobacter sp. HDW13]|uniref:4,5-DOPA-extradiol-dioxygenase n=1 Tax=unclassified Pedobacter TaxID=2628915 RepID=UPI000F5A2F0F|nr:MULTISPECIES: 4,5-DOPA dioxygenase extradiol [unclassified Pedobacter]QIL39532.1 4,5-DOPA dioxygenase extradiol [Pedobacter sp. HDW13]RQO78582.1 4,5-DOPA dioxygenase extradiol [Pedobacter sp. KBW01]